MLFIKIYFIGTIQVRKTS